MQTTVMEPVQTLEYHRLCECGEFSAYHNPHKCPNDGDKTCGKCGRQVCDECIWAGLCITCRAKQ